MASPRLEIEVPLVFYGGTIEDEGRDGALAVAIAERGELEANIARRGDLELAETGLPAGDLGRLR